MKIENVVIRYLLFFLFFASYSLYAQTKTVKEVHDVRSFFKALDDNVEILIKTDTLDLTESALIETLSIIKYNYDTYFPYQRTKKSYFIEEDGLVIFGYENLSIKGDENLSKLISHNSFGDIITFKNCKNLTLENLVMNHTSENCTGLVLSLVFTKNAFIKNCSFNGSGAVGVNMIGSRNIVFKDVAVFNNAFHAMVALNSREIMFVDSEIYENNLIFDEHNLCNIQFSELSFESCNFENNKSKNLYNEKKDLEDYYFSLEEEEYANYYNDDLTQNLEVSPFIPRFNNCSFFDNAFEPFENKKNTFNESVVSQKEIFTEFFMKKLVRKLNGKWLGVYNDSFSICGLASFFKTKNITLNEKNQQTREDFISYYSEVLSELEMEKFAFKNMMATSTDSFFVVIEAESENKKIALEFYVVVSDDLKITHFEIKK